MLAAIATQNLLSPPVLFFLLGLFASVVRSDLAVPDQVARLLALYLMMSIGFRGGLEIAHHGASAQLLAVVAAGVTLSFVTPIVAERLLRLLTTLVRTDRAAIAGHYGSISAVTFAAAIAATSQLSLPHEGFLVAVAAAMETPAIVSCLVLAGGAQGAVRRGVLREVALNGSVITLIGALAVGALASPNAASAVKPFLVDLFPGFLCLFLLEMGLIAGRGLRDSRAALTPGLLAFGLLQPIAGAALGALLACVTGLSVGGTAIFITLAASASYIAVPAALRLALPQANLAVALTLSIGVTFPFNLLFGIPAYIAIAKVLAP